MTDEREWSSKRDGWCTPIPEEPFEPGDHRVRQFFNEEQVELSAVAKTAIYMMDTVTAMVNRVIRWADKGLGGPL